MTTSVPSTSMVDSVIVVSIDALDNSVVRRFHVIFGVGTP